MEESKFRLPRGDGSETTQQIHLKFGMFDYVRRSTTHAEYGGRRKWAEGWAYG